MTTQPQTYNVTVLMSMQELLAAFLGTECHFKMILDDVANTLSLRELELRLELVRQSAQHFEEAESLIEQAQKASEYLLNIYQRRRLDDEWIVEPEERQHIAKVFRLAEFIQIQLSRRENMQALSRAKEVLSNKALFGIV